MGTIEKNGETFVFRQDDGEITAWFEDVEEKMVLAHKGSPTYKKVFYVLVIAGIFYLAFVFLLSGGPPI
jgi:hypothetical protein